MLIRLRIIGLVLLGLALATGAAQAQGLTIQGDVKGPNGKAVNGAEVRLERKGGKTAASVAKTDAKGQYAFIGLASGIYKVTARVNNVPTSIDNVRTRTDGAVRVDFDIKASAAQANAAGKKAKHMVWVPAATGTNIGGRWVEVDENSANRGADRVDTANGDSLRRLQGTMPNKPEFGGR